MQLEHPSETIAEALGAALHRDFSEISYKGWTPKMKRDGLTKEEAPIKHRRPSTRDVEITMFAESWGSTALGYGGMGGSAITPAYTVIVECGQVSEACVYWGCGRLGVKLDLTDRDQSRALREAKSIQSTYDLKKSVTA